MSAQTSLNDTDTQAKAIRHLLLSGKSITPIEALKWYGCFRLSARILEIRQEGLNVHTDMVTVGKKRFARYYIEKT